MLVFLWSFWVRAVLRFVTNPTRKHIHDLDTATAGQTETCDGGVGRPEPSPVLRFPGQRPRQEEPHAFSGQSFLGRGRLVICDMPIAGATLKNPQCVGAGDMGPKSVEAVARQLAGIDLAKFGLQRPSVPLARFAMAVPNFEVGSRPWRE